MKRKIQQIVSLMCIFALLLSGAYAALPGGDTIKPQYIYVSEISSGLTMTATGRASCSCDVRVEASTYPTTLTMYLEQSSDGVNWDEVKSWSTSGYVLLGLSHDWYVVPGYTYRTRAVAEIYNTNNVLVETVERTSQEYDYSLM